MTNEQARTAVAEWLSNLMATVATDDPKMVGYADVLKALQDDEEALFMTFDQVEEDNG